MSTSRDHCVRGSRQIQKEHWIGGGHRLSVSYGTPPVPPLWGCDEITVVRSLSKGKRSLSVFFFFFLSWVSESTLYSFTLEPGLIGVYPASLGESQSIPPGPVTLTSADGGKVPHVVEKFADDRTGPGVQAVAADPQVELDPAGLQAELQRGIQGSEIQLLLVYLVSPERAGRVFLQLGAQGRKDLPRRLVWTLRSFIHLARV